MPVMSRTPYNWGPKFTERAFYPYALAIGQTALAWNALHEALGKLFWTTVRGEWFAQSLNVWQSLRSDRSKRDLLQAAAAYPPATFRENRPRFVADVNWLLKEVTKLEEIRNNVIHSPLHLVISEEIANSDMSRAELKRHIRVEPQDMLQNSRAQKLVNKILLAEFRYCRDMAVTLTDYAMMMDSAMLFPRLAWPDRPTLPVHRDSKKK